MPVDYQLSRSKRRKTLAIQIKQGQVKVVAPHWLAKGEIDQLVQQKQHWIEAKLSQQQQWLAEQPQSTEITENSELRLFAKPLTLALQQDKKTYYQFNADTYSLALILSSRIQVANQQVYYHKLLQGFYTEQLNDYIRHRLPLLADNMGLVYRSWQVKNYKAKWGACNSRGELSFSWRLAVMPFEVIDSVMIHELAHLKHLNHSAAFWRLVQRFDPLHQQHKQSLSDHNRYLF